MKHALSCSTLLGVLALSGSSFAQDFTVRLAADDSEVYTGTLTDQFDDLSLGIQAQFADFSELDEPGEYYVDVPGFGRSATFLIGDDVYDGELTAIMLGFYGWRSGVDIDFEFHGQQFSHVAGHTSDALIDLVDPDRAGETKDGTGGWYDAGDYGKYLPTATVTVVMMLSAWEAFSDDLEHLQLPFIPEHDGPLPDFLAELKWELDWLLKMAYDDGSGRVHHQVNSIRYPEFVLPVEDPTERYFATFSTAATAEFAATMAKAARVFEPHDAEYAATLLAAAETSYEYLRENPDDVSYNASEIPTGTYEKSDSSDRFWAAAEFFVATGDLDALEEFESKIPFGSSFAPNFDWDSTKNYGLLAYLGSDRAERNPDIVAALETRLDEVAQRLVAGHASSAYGRDYGDYYWGSNGVIARTCMLLQAAYQRNPEPAYLDVCADQIGYLLGRNQYNRSQVTGVGIEPPLFPHDRRSGSDAVTAPYPGLLVGGGESAVGWVDEQRSATTNEVAINYNAALVYALAGFLRGEGAATSLGRGPVAPGDCGVRLNSIGFRPERSKVATVQADCELPDLPFACTMDDETMSGDTGGPLSMIDDLEDGDADILTREGRSGSWYSLDDGSDGTRTEIEVGPTDRDGSDQAICISGSGFTAWGGGIGLSLNGEGSSRQPYDGSRYTGLSFWARGSSPFRAMLIDEFSDPAGNQCSGCWDHFHFPFTPTSDWHRYTFTWDEAELLGFGDVRPSVCAASLFAIQFQWLAAQDFELCIDDLAFTTAEGTVLAGDGAAGAGGSSNSGGAGGAAGAGGATPPVRFEVSGGGCACRIGGQRGPSPWSTTLALIAVAVARRRRRP